jgi:putative ABC transport system permease protein
MNKLLLPIKLSIKSLGANIGRTILSLLGIVIGVMAIVLVMSFGEGVKIFVVDQIESFGTDFVEIEIKTPKTGKTSTQNVEHMVGGTQITTFKLKDAEKASKLNNIEAWYAGIMSQQITSYRNKNKQAMMMGVTAGIKDADEQAKIESGRFFSEEEDNSLKQVIVIGSGFKKKFFPNEEAVGRTIKIKKQSYKVIGVLEERGSAGVFSFDDMIYIPLQTLQKKLMGIDYIQFAIFRVNDKNKMELIASQMTDLMRREHDIDDPDDDDFAVTSIAEVMEMLDKVFAIINALLLALTSISLLVGGVGIMNVMYVSVTERTFEIGLRKSLGAKRKDILQQFLFEGIFLTLFGGLIGIALGFVISKIAEFIAAKFGFFLSFPLSFQSIVIALGFSLFVGLIFSLRPAYKASKLSPMEALRKE